MSRIASNPLSPSMQSADPDPHVSWLTRVARSGLAEKLVKGFVVGIGTRVLMLVMHVVIGRQLGLHGYGIFALMTGIVTLSANLGTLGWNKVITRLVAQYHVEKQWALLHGVIIRGDQIVFRVTTGVGVLLCLGSWLFASDPAIRVCLLIAGISIPIVAMRQYRCRQLLGMHKTRTAMFLESGAVPALVVIIALMFGVRSAAQAVLIYSLMSLAIAFLLKAMVFRKLPGEVFQSPPKFETRQWQSIATPAILGQSGGVLMRRIDLLMIGPMLGVSAVGLYSSAFRVSFALQCIPVVIGLIVQPIFVSAWYAGRIDKVKRVFVRSLLASIAISIPVAGVLLVFPEQVMSIFGKEFTGGTTLLVVFIAGQIVNAMTGPVAPLLVMTGNERIFGISTGVVAALNIIGNLIAIPLFGVMGAAVMAACCIVTLNAWQFHAAWKHLRTPNPNP